MTHQRISIKLSRSNARYDIQIGHGLLQYAGEWAKKCIGQPGRIAIISNPKVITLYGDTLAKSLALAGFDVKTHLIGDGERYKNFRTLQRTLDFLGENKLTRSDAVVALHCVYDPAVREHIRLRDRRAGAVLAAESQVVWRCA